jgi:hypothetical protein
MNYIMCWVQQPLPSSPYSLALLWDCSCICSWLSFCIQCPLDGVGCPRLSFSKKMQNLQNNKYLLTLKPKFMTKTVTVNYYKWKFKYCFSNLDMHLQQSYALDHHGWFRRKTNKKNKWSDHYQNSSNVTKQPIIRCYPIIFPYSNTKSGSSKRKQIVIQYHTETLIEATPLKHTLLQGGSPCLQHPGQRIQMQF